MTDLVPIARPSLWSDTVVLAGRQVRLMVRSPQTLVLTAVFPLILLCLISVSFATVIMPGDDYAAYVDYTVPLFAIMGITFAALSTAIAAHTDRTTGYTDRLATLPISPLAPLAGRIIADSIRNLATLGVVTIAGMLLGFRFTEGPVGVIGYVLVALIYGFGLAWLMVAVALITTSAEAAVSSLNVLLLVASFLSTGFVTLEDLPGWAQPIASANPVSHVVEAMRGLAHGGDALSDTLVTIAWSLALTVVFGFVAVRASTRR